MKQANDFLRRQTLVAMAIYWGCAAGFGWSCVLPTQSVRLVANLICAVIMTWIIVVRSGDPDAGRQTAGMPGWLVVFLNSLPRLMGFLLLGVILSSNQAIRPDPYLRLQLAMAMALLGIAMMKDPSTLRRESAQRADVDGGAVDTGASGQESPAGHSGPVTLTEALGRRLVSGRAAAIAGAGSVYAFMVLTMGSGLYIMHRHRSGFWTGFSAFALVVFAGMLVAELGQVRSYAPAFRRRWAVGYFAAGILLAVYIAYGAQSGSYLCLAPAMFAALRLPVDIERLSRVTGESAARESLLEARSLALVASGALISFGTVGHIGYAVVLGALVAFATIRQDHNAPLPAIGLLGALGILVGGAVLGVAAGVVARPGVDPLSSLGWACALDGMVVLSCVAFRMIKGGPKASLNGDSVSASDV